MVGGGGDDGPMPATLTTYVNHPAIDNSAFDAFNFCENEVVDLRPLFSPMGGTFSWGFGSDAYMMDVAELVASPGETVNYYYTDEFGCTGSVYPTANTFTPPTVNVTPTDVTSCGAADGMASATLFGDGPFDVYWSTGFEELGVGVGVPTLIMDQAPGAYYVNVTSAFGCKQVAPAPISDAAITVVEAITPEDCMDESANGAIDLTVTPSTGAVSSIFWSNGEESEDLTGLSQGEYFVQIHTDSDCHFYGVYDVTAPTPLKIDDDWFVGDASCFLPANGVVNITTIGGTAPYSWLWSNAETSEDIGSLDKGDYSCTITDDNDCTLEVEYTVGVYDGPGIWTNGITKSICAGADGAIDLNVFPSGGLIVSTIWDHGPTTEDVTDLAPGDYTITVLDDAGCEIEKTFTVPSLPPTQPELCLLTVDTSLTYNEIVWQKEDFMDATGFRIYRETSTFGDFELIKDKPFADVSSFQDNQASPVDRSWRYKIASYDDCGNESFGSFIHKTIHVVAHTSDMINYDLAWDDYEGISYTDIVLERHDNVSGWVEVATLPYGTNTYPDIPRY